ncbi:MAG: hypothetical protein AB8G99_04985, partial [Planctomycetaceae bacterium]
MLAGGVRTIATGFDRTIAFASEGHDRAYFKDSNGKDKLTAKPTQTLLVGPGLFARADDFDQVIAEASNSKDLAVFYDSTKADTFTQTPNYSRMENEDFRVTAKFFGINKGYSRGG